MQQQWHNSPDKTAVQSACHTHKRSALGLVVTTTLVSFTCKLSMAEAASLAALGSSCLAATNTACRASLTTAGRAVVAAPLLTSQSGAAPETPPGLHKAMHNTH